MRSFGLPPKRFLPAAMLVLFLPLLAEVANWARATAPLPAASAAQMPAESGQPDQQGCAFGGVSFEGSAIALESQDRRFGRRIAQEELNLARPRTASDHGCQRFSSQQPLLTSWVTTLTTAAEPCAVLCCFLR